MLKKIFLYWPRLLRWAMWPMDLLFKVISERPVVLTSKCRAFGEGAITTYFKRLMLTRPAREGLELTTLLMLSESTTTRLPQPVWRIIFILYSHKEKVCISLFQDICVELKIKSCFFHGRQFQIKSEIKQEPNSRNSFGGLFIFGKPFQMILGMFTKFESSMY
jgi:hypothetical protein